MKKYTTDELMEALNCLYDVADIGARESEKYEYLAQFIEEHSDNGTFEKREVTTQDEARQYAIEWQHWAGEQSLSYGELAEWGAIFEELAERFDLVEEFKENCII